MSIFGRNRGLGREGMRRREEEEGRNGRMEEEKRDEDYKYNI